MGLRLSFRYWLGLDRCDGRWAVSVWAGFSLTVRRRDFGGRGVRRRVRLRDGWIFPDETMHCHQNQPRRLPPKSPIQALDVSF